MRRLLELYRKHGFSGAPYHGKRSLAAMPPNYAFHDRGHRKNHACGTTPASASCISSQQPQIEYFWARFSQPIGMPSVFPGDEVSLRYGAAKLVLILLYRE